MRAGMYLEYLPYYPQNNPNNDMNFSGRTVSKEGANKGRLFYCCVLSQRAGM
ncbi:hypothetical protein OS493_003229 [Desmophyllum pertusum]|uniref:Uncharacterized protein n=1 Tax=Desmophyllum pertusum TaxID=174260 RepID=A0A9X0CH65_9CNID|nr:hypothetical protein OS493_003229 [Desmophyllum pertusum]